ncbi:MAG: heme exporter protein CcmD [Pseudomonadota bacterium]
MVIDQHFGFIAFSWAAGIIGFAGIAFWIWRDRKALDTQLAELEGQGVDVSRAKEMS